MLKKNEHHHRTGRLVKNAYSSTTRQSGCVFKDIEPPKSSSILRKNSDIRKPIQRVKFTEAVVRHVDIRDQNPSLGYICPGEPHERSSNAAREAAWKLAKSVLKFKEHERATFFSPSENRCLPASNLKPEEREFVVDSGASMHMISKKDLSDAEMDTLTKSCSPTIVITANGEVQTHEEAIVYVKELDIFLTMKVLENTPAVLSLGKLCDEHGYSYEWINGQKATTSHYKTYSDTVQHRERRSDRGSWFVNEFFLQFSFFNINGTFRQEIDHPTSSSSSSTSPTTTVSSDSETRAREDLCGIDSHPVTVSSKHVERKERGDPLTKPNKNPKPNKNENHERERSESLYSDFPEYMQEFRENLVDGRVPERRDSHASSSHEASFRADRKET